MAALFISLPFSASAQTQNDLDIPALVQALNEDRQTFGLHQLRRSAILDTAAELKAADMVANHYFAHTSPQNIEPWYWFAEVGYEYIYAGENLALDFTDAKTVQNAWMDSPKHRENILNAEYDEVGYAIAYGTFNNINGVNKTRQGPIIVQLFGRLAPSATLVLDFSSRTPENKVFEKEPGFLSPEGITLSVNRLSSRMLGTVINYSVAKEGTVATGQTIIKPKTFNTTPPYETWPAVSLGLVMLLMSAGLHGKLLYNI